MTTDPVASASTSLSPAPNSLGRRRAGDGDDVADQGEDEPKTAKQKQQQPQQREQPEKNEIRTLNRSVSGELLRPKKKTVSPSVIKKRVAVSICFLSLGLFWMFLIPHIDYSSSSSSVLNNHFISPSREHFHNNKKNAKNKKGNKKIKKIPLAFQRVLQRARQQQQHCQSIHAGFTNDNELDSEYIQIANFTTARLRSFGIIDALEHYYYNNHTNVVHNNNNASSSKYEEYPECILPPEQECNETQFTVIFMAYNPDRLKKTFKQMKYMLEDEKFKQLVAEVILVWNGPRDVNESDAGKNLLLYSQKIENNLRVVYPLKQGLPNDLMNRYHPDVVKVTKTKGILYYDDDGPFYSYEAVLGGFELWKRHSNAQMGAMARNIRLNKRQQQEKANIIQNSTNTRMDSPHYHDSNKDRFFVSHCPAAAAASTPDNNNKQNIIKENDIVEYNYNIFANFEANMALPSGSMLHANYLCFLWHPALQPIRQFVLDHPVHPDDMTVSMIVSQLSGRAPRVYSRRVNPPPEQNHRKLLFDINWDAGAGMTNAKEKWAKLRSGAVNSLVRFFGSINSGSIGWCYRTPYHNTKKNTCDPEFAKIGYYPWMTPDHKAKPTCP